MVREVKENELNKLLELYLHLHEDRVPPMDEHLINTWNTIMNDRNHHIIVKEIDKRFVSSCVCVIIPNLTRGIRPCITFMATPAKAFAAKQATPSGIEYSNIGSSIDEFVKKYEKGLVSCEVSVFDEDGMLYSGCYGFTDIENGIAADKDSVYEWGSAAKLLVWVSVMQQWERGNIDLDKDIREYLPEGFLTKLQYEDEKITMLNLMNHNAGFQESFYENQLCSEDELFSSLEEALKYCECYQAYHPGEYTAYSNYGTSLAAYIVERVSGEKYADYVKKNIFEPLGINNTSVDMHLADNTWVKEKRSELKCYYRGEDPSYDEDYGSCYSWIMLTPSGQAVGTLEDFAKFGQAFVSKECPLFEKETTRELMFSPASYYGDSDIAKNCHGLWTDECSIQILGHAGNTIGCSSMLKFDPVSKLGVVVMTNEPGETMFNYGIVNLLFGKITDRAELQNIDGKDELDISGLYRSKRAITEGAVSFQKYSGNYYPFKKNDNGTYGFRMLGINMNPEVELFKVGDNQYVFDSNGMLMFMYHSIDKAGNSKLEMMATDIVSEPSENAGALYFLFAIIVGVLCMVMLIVKLIMTVIRKLRKSEKHFSLGVTLTQAVYFLNFIVVYSYISFGISAKVPFAVVSGILAAALGVFALTNGIILFYKTVKDKGINSGSRIYRFLWSILSSTYIIFTVAFETYKFWTL